MTNSSNKLHQSFSSFLTFIENRDGASAVGYSDFPNRKSYSLLNAAKLLDEYAKVLRASGKTDALASLETFDSADPLFEKLRRLADQVQGLASASTCPIVAITGVLNAGKTSMLAGIPVQYRTSTIANRFRERRWNSSVRSLASSELEIECRDMERGDASPHPNLRSCSGRIVRRPVTVCQAVQRRSSISNG